MTPAPAGIGTLEAHLCRVGGLNANYKSTSGTLYHIQVEDKGPLIDRVTEAPVRRLNLVIFANYGEPNARIVHSHDADLLDLRTREHNKKVQQKVQGLGREAQGIIEEKEIRQVSRIQRLIRDYHHTKDEGTKREFEEANSYFPFLFSRAWRQLKAQKPTTEAKPEPAAEAQVTNGSAAQSSELESLVDEVLYPLDVQLRELVLDIERVITTLDRDVDKLRAKGLADDILLQTIRKLVTRARENISGRLPSEFSARRLDMTRNSLMTTWRQVRSRLRALEQKPNS